MPDQAADSRRAFGIFIAIAAIWTLVCALIWISNTWGRATGNIHEPAVVGLSLGLAAILSFTAIYFRERSASADRGHRLRSAIAGSVVLLFLLLVIDLMTIAGFRDSLQTIREAGGGNTASNSTSPAPTADEAFSFVEGIFDTFKWVVITVVGFYFAAGAAEAVGSNIQKASETRAQAAVQVAQLQTQAPSATGVESQQTETQGQEVTE
jgi:hypothetical protein